MKKKLDYEIQGVEGKDEVTIKLTLNTKSAKMKWILNAAFFRLRGYNQAVKKELMDNLDTIKEWEIPPENREKIIPMIKMGSNGIFSSIKKEADSDGIIIYEHNIERVTYYLNGKDLMMSIYARAPATKK